MSDLQIGLLILGVLVVAGVVVFNWWQEREFRRRSERRFAPPESGALFEPRVCPSALERTDPWIAETGHDDADAVVPEVGRRAPAAPPAQPKAKAVSTVHEGADQQPSPIDYVVELRAGEVISADQIESIRQSLAVLQRPVTLHGYDYHSKRWEALDGGDGWYTSLRLALQLVDRNGTTTLDQLERFAGLARQQATGIAAIAEVPDPGAGAELAIDLDEFCGTVDVIVGISVIAHTGQMFQGTQIRALAEAQGMELQPSGVFVYPGEGGVPLFTLDNQEAKPFRVAEMRQLTTSGITFLLDVPRTADGVRAFDRMVATSRQFADALDGMLADDNRNLLNDVGLDKIRNQLRSLYELMARRGIPAGSREANRLFS